ncbi:MAG: thymidylate synthase [Candidatus Magasanikbacteria bacterium RIFCSPHIGHO2_01_FULL_33_34]|uniref:Thymidylate synthase n=1 Tax=Candidatus Magasanikbacteria bacterium RIFCSPHIGHO2_01_FULL_33_34 TaxID=1798671 RepID=A0A1F6LJB1_9BACT|nr:MAG: thymidylate synthase [Candidatus Magasanikbacteria bacterium RIFCSPHIGHO2_01_FULL_33_34]OGH65496.1 MAG: thymidylate synthase [Candidatus Magasanikbacteria bacterium RIFCSPHIGHO2_02_FULL_33_17]OGH76206.1 MAG: thymidylate synthase [Candidatus Magasanikbacteria bacterium RIFCSPLOWO2_01_FULL_33_34]OGH82612.1 MAG: thymidylate synthase [Candidatus Magasanikbacteria bacterium RIFCSPLOWO2_12_FULL_34_7]
MQAYLDIVKKVLNEGIKKDDRTGTGTLAIAGAMFEHDMSKGFPLITTKKMPYKVIASELEFFIKGLTDKKWLQENKNHIWDEWANPKKAPYGHDIESKNKMAEERDLGPIYGFQWRHFNAPYYNYDTDYRNQGVDQLQKVINTLKENPTDRRMIVCAWNPTMMDQMALPPCHYSFQVTVLDGKINLLWNQRSVDVMLGLPFNIASYATMLHLLAKETKLGEGKLVGFLADVHIYSNHIEGAHEQITRDPNKFPLPKLVTENFTNIFDWQCQNSKIVGYESYPKISFDIAI